MALAQSSLASGQSGTFVGTGAFTTGSIVVPANSLIVVKVYTMLNGGGVNPSTSITVAKTGGGGPTFTSRVNTGDTASFSIGVAILTAEDATGGTYTLDIDCGANNIYRYGYNVTAYTGYNTGGFVGATASDNSGGSDGAFATLTLSGTPASSSYIETIVGTDGPAAGTLGPLKGSAWTSLYRFCATGDCAFGTAYKTGHTTTDVPWDDVDDGGSNCFKSVGVALEILAAAGGGSAFYNPISGRGAGAAHPLASH